jgi:hypothetical protein
MRQSPQSQPATRHRGSLENPPRHGTQSKRRGRSSVRDYIAALHNNMSDAQTRRIVVSDGHAYLEGDCVQAPAESGSRIFYCVAYDIVDGRITAMRCYGPVADMAS